MKIWTKFLCLTLLCLGLVQPALAGPKRHLEELFLMLPKTEFLEGTPKQLMAWFKRGVFDSKNGYMSLEGDGAQVSLQVALFRLANDQPLLAVSHGELEDTEFTRLSFFTEGKNGKTLAAVDRGIFPVAEQAGLSFHLPRQGRTVLVKNARGKVVAQATWNGSKFVLGE